MADGEAEVRRILAAKDYFQILGLELPDVTVDDVKKAHRKLVLKVHPDKCQAEGAAEAFDELTKAMTLLSDEDVLDSFKEMWNSKERRQQFEQDPSAMQAKQVFGTVLRRCWAACWCTSSHTWQSMRICSMRRNYSTAEKYCVANGFQLLNQPGVCIDSVTGITGQLCHPQGCCMPYIGTWLFIMDAIAIFIATHARSLPPCTPPCLLPSQHPTTPPPHQILVRYTVAVDSDVVILRALRKANRRSCWAPYFRLGQGEHNPRAPSLS